MSAIKKNAGAEARRQRDLRVFEQVIENARQSFLDMGRALEAIRDERLFEGDFESFEEYVGDRWDMTARQAYRLITSYRINLILRPIGHKLQSEAAARELVPIAEDESTVIAVYEEAVRRAAGGRITAALVAAARDALAPPVIEGDWRDESDEDEPTGGEIPHLAEPDPLSLVPDAERAVNALLNRPPADDSEADGADPTSGGPQVTGADVAGPSAPVANPETTEDAIPGDAAQNPTDGDPDDLGDEAGSEASPEAPSDDAAGREQQAPAGVSVPAAPVSKPFEFPDVDKLRQRTDLDQEAVEDYARKTEAHALALWRDDLTTAFVNFRKAFRAVSPEDIYEKADDELINLIVNTHADIQEKWTAVAELKVAAEKASRSNVVQLRSVS